MLCKNVQIAIYLVRNLQNAASRYNDPGDRSAVLRAVTLKLCLWGIVVDRNYHHRRRISWSYLNEEFSRFFYLAQCWEAFDDSAEYNFFPIHRFETLKGQVELRVIDIFAVAARRKNARFAVLQFEILVGERVAENRRAATSVEFRDITTLTPVTRQDTMKRRTSENPSENWEKDIRENSLDPVLFYILVGKTFEAFAERLKIFTRSGHCIGEQFEHDFTQCSMVLLHFDFEVTLRSSRADDRSTRRYFLWRLQFFLGFFTS